MDIANEIIEGKEALMKFLLGYNIQFSIKEVGNWYDCLPIKNRWYVSDFTENNDKIVFRIKPD